MAPPSCSWPALASSCIPGSTIAADGGASGDLSNIGALGQTDDQLIGYRVALNRDY
jgi:hypothetical protein